MVCSRKSLRTRVPMKDRCSFMLFAAIVLLIAIRPASAQVSAYGTIAVTNYAYSFNGDALNEGKDRVGIGAGGFYNFPIQSRLTAGIDVRGSVTPGPTGGEKVFVSGRIGFVPKRNPLRPYVQIGGGVISANVPGYSNIVHSQTATHGALDLALGLDVRLSRGFDWRAMEVESGAGVGSNSSSGSASISTGVLYRFGPRA